MNPYQPFVSEFHALKSVGNRLPFGGIEPVKREPRKPDAPVAMIFAPHPDDECIIGGLPLRLLKEAGYRVLNVAVTQGSNPARRLERWRELQGACAYIGFELIATAEGGLERINPKGREDAPDQWRTSVKTITEILRNHSPQVIFFPHDRDWNSTHLGVHHLVHEALQGLGGSFRVTAIETEFWGQNQSPNLMVESSVADVAELVAATSFHEGEVKRNPYHLVLPAWMMDNVRRGGELVGGQGEAAPKFTFATLYRLRKWNGQGFDDLYHGGRSLAVSDSPVLW